MSAEEDRISEVLRIAGAEHESRRPAGEVIDFPVMSKFLKPQPRDRMAEGRPITDPPKVPQPMPLWLRVVKYAALLAFFCIGAWVYSTERREAILADIGATTCSDMSLMIEDDPGSNVPRMKEAVLTRCAKAFELF